MRHETARYPSIISYNERLHKTFFEKKRENGNFFENEQMKLTKPVVWVYNSDKYTTRVGTSWMWRRLCACVNF